MARTICMLDTQGYMHARVPTEICNICCFFTATVVSRTRLIVTSYVHCLSCFLLVLSLVPKALLCGFTCLRVAMPEANRKCPRTNIWPVCLCRWVPRHDGDLCRLVVSDVTGISLCVRSGLAGLSWVGYCTVANLVTDVGGDAWLDFITCVHCVITQVRQHAPPPGLYSVILAAWLCQVGCSWIACEARHCAVPPDYVTSTCHTLFESQSSRRLKRTVTGLLFACSRWELNLKYTYFWL
jgi:hypothetical protein